MFETEGEVLLHFLGGGDMLDAETGCVYISDIGGEGSAFYGIMVTPPVPRVLRHDLPSAVEYALGHFPAPASCHPRSMVFMEAPGCWFSELAEDVLSRPDSFVT